LAENLEMKTVLRITDAKVAAAFANDRQRNLVLQLVNREQSLQELAEVSKISLSLLHYHVGRLERLGLIGVVRYKARSGRPIKIFRSTARSFFVPAYLMSRSPEEELYAELRACLDRSRRGGEGEGMLYFVDEHASARMRKMRGRVAVPGAEFWLRISLSNANAQSLAEDMKLLLARYQRCGTSPTRAYVVHCAIAPK
jgi:hypothetical protein